MIARLCGKLIEKNVEHVIIDVNGVGYMVLVSAFTHCQLPELEQPVTLLIHTYVREDALVLFGFLAKYERDFFVLLMSVNKVGAKMAKNILSGIQPEELSSAIERSDFNMLVKIPGVGTKLAQRLVLELKDKVGKIELPFCGKLPDKSAVEEHSLLLSDIRSALENLGYPSKKITVAIQKIKNTEDLDSLSLTKGIKTALKALTKTD